MDDIQQSVSNANSNRKSILKTYYAKYLKDVRGLTDSSVNHYYDALNNISKRLKNKADRLAESGLKISKDDFEKIVGMAN